MKNIYQSLLDYTPVGQSDPTLSFREEDKRAQKGSVISYHDQANGLEATLYSPNLLELSRMVGPVKATYALRRDGALYSQKITLPEQDKKIEICYEDAKHPWFDVFLNVGNEINDWYRLLPTNPDPEEHIWYNGDPKENPPSGLPFDGQINRWEGGHGTYNNSHHVVEIMKHSKGILFEDLDQAKVCDMFQITQEELLALPALLVQKHALQHKL